MFKDLFQRILRRFTTNALPPHQKKAAEVLKHLEIASDMLSLGEQTASGDANHILSLLNDWDGVSVFRLPGNNQRHRFSRGSDSAYFLLEYVGSQRCKQLGVLRRATDSYEFKIINVAILMNGDMIDW